MTNEELIAAHQSGNASAFDELWARNSGLRAKARFTFAREKRDQEEADGTIDLAFWHAAEQFDGTKGVRFSSYFMRAARNAMIAETVFNSCAKRDVSRVTSIDEVRTSGGFRLKDAIPGVDGNPVDLLAAREEESFRDAELARRLKRLPRRERTIYEWLKQGLNYREISEELGVVRERGRQLGERMLNWLRMTDEEFWQEKRRCRSLGGGTPNGRPKVRRKRELVY
jgi:RNA polymerase sigma factor (sigma-70 family)